MNLREMWTDWPSREMDGLMKFYVLAQWAFWLQQIIVINIEDRRKDHWQMFSHHIITTLLISSCYCYHFTRVGNFILVLMDVVDLFFPVSVAELDRIKMTNNRGVARQVSQVLGPQHSLRHHVWSLHAIVVCCATRLLRHGLLVGVRAHAEYYACRLL